MASSVNNIACPKCKTFLRPPFTMCEDHHWLCKNCRQHIHRVSGEPVAYDEMCGDDQLPTPLLNKLFRDIMDECQYGCGHRTNIVDLAEHEEVCPIRTKCAIKACYWLGPIGKLVKHVDDDHPERLVDISAVVHNFSLGFEHPVLLLTQWNKTSPNNVFYWLRFYENKKSKFIMMQYAAQIGRKADKTFLVKEYSVSPINYPKLPVKIEVVFTKSNEDDILKDKFVESQGTDVTVFNSNEFQINIKDVSPQISESLALNLECFICAEIMSAPIRMCVTGHSFCDTCCGKIDNKCPNCQKEINPTARNYTLEALTENLLANIGNEMITGTPCKYKDCGCPVFPDRQNIDGHVEVCEYQPMMCLQTTDKGWCKWRGPHTYLIEHIVAEHGLSLQPIDTPHLVSYNRGSYYYYFDNNYFMCQLNLSANIETRGKIYFRHLTTQTKSDYNFKVNVVDKEGEVLEVYSRSCKSKGALSMGHVVTRQLLSLLRNDQIPIMVNITRKTPRNSGPCYNGWQY